MGRKNQTPRLAVFMRVYNRGGFFVATYIMKSEHLPVRLSIKQKIKKKLRKKCNFSEIFWTSMDKLKLVL